MISGHITVKIYMRKMNRKTLRVQRPQPPTLNDAPDMKARSYSLALCGLNVGAWRRHPNAVDRSQNLRSCTELCMDLCCLPGVTTNNSL